MLGMYAYCECWDARRGRRVGAVEQHEVRDSILGIVKSRVRIGGIDYRYGDERAIACVWDWGWVAGVGERLVYGF
jgi:hypothetical protein